MKSEGKTTLPFLQQYCGFVANIVIEGKQYLFLLV